MEFSFLTLLEAIAVITGLVHVFLLTREKVIAWPFGLLSVGLYVYIFQDARLYSDVILHLVYIGLNIYGWWNWSRKDADQATLPVSSLSRSARFLYLVFILAGTLVWGALMQRYTDASYPFPDAFTTVASLVAQFLLTRKKLENWLIWIVVDVVAMNIYALKGLYLTTGLYGVYLLICIKGLLDWQRSLRTVP